MELTIEKRERTGSNSLKALRKGGSIPAIIYGKKEKATAIKVDDTDFRKVFKKAGESTIITLKGVGDDKDVLVQEVDFEPVKGGIRHVDFYAIERGKKLTVHVPLEFVGESPAVKGLGGILVKVMHEIEIEVLPRDLPQHIDVDISAIVDFDTSIHIKDLKLPEGVTATSEPDEVVALADLQEEEVFEAPEVIDMDAIGDAEEKGKGEEEDGDEGEGKEKDKD